jgi:hypothetical protein
VTECSELISIHVKCEIFRMELTACEKLHKCIVENQIAHVRVADCSYLLKFEGTKNIEQLKIRFVFLFGERVFVSTVTDSTSGSELYLLS